jgi:outer membrane protein TolC
VDRGETELSQGEFVPPFPMEDVQLSAALTESIQNNLDLQGRVVDVGIAEAQILASLGAFDVTLIAGTSASLSETPQRGSAFTFSTATRTLSGYAGFSRRLETGGNISLRVDASRTLTDQPINFFDTSAGTNRLATYVIRPTLQITHPLLRGVGIKVNRANIDRARIATNQAEATELSFAQDMVRDIISAYWDLLFAKRDLGNKRQAVELQQQQLSRTQAQVSAGRLSPVEAKAVEQALAVRESEVLVAENALLDASVTMRSLMGQRFEDRDLLGVMPTTDPTLIQPEPVDFQTEIKKALKTNPQIRQLELAMASKRIDEIEAANQRLPQLDFTGTFTPQGRSVDTNADPSTGDPGQKGSWGEAFGNFFNDDVGADGLMADYTVSAALDLTWGVQNRTAKGNHQRVQAELRRAELNLDVIRQTIATSVIRAANGLRTAGKRMQVADISMELAEQNLDAERARFDVGRSTNYDVNFRIDELSKAQAEALSAQVDYLKALVQLQSLTGEILPAYGIDLAG